MDSKKLLSLFILFLTFSFAYSQMDTQFEIEKKDDDNFDISLVMDKTNNLSEINVKGFAFVKGKSKSFDIVYDSKDLKKHKGNRFNLHELPADTDYVLYTITTYDKDGERKQYPSQKVNMPDGYSFSSKF